MVSRTPSTSSSRPSPTASTSSSATPRPRSGPRSRSTPLDPILEGYWIRAKDQASREHDANEALRRTRTIGRQLTRRQRSNKRSAMICRAATKIYIRFLEAGLLESDESRLQLYNGKLAQTAEIVELRRKIETFENKLAEEKEMRCVFYARSSLDDIQEVEQFVPPVVRFDDWGFDDTLAHSEPSYHGDRESELERSMDFLLGYHTDSEITYIEGDAMSTMTACEGVHTSPVAISETAVEVPKGSVVPRAIGK